MSKGRRVGQDGLCYPLLYTLGRLIPPPAGPPIGPLLACLPARLPGLLSVAYISNTQVSYESKHSRNLMLDGGNLFQQALARCLEKSEMVDTISESFPSCEDFIAPFRGATNAPAAQPTPQPTPQPTTATSRLPSLRSGGFEPMWFGSYASSVADSVRFVNATRDPLPTTHDPLPTTHYPRPTTHYPLPTSRHPTRCNLADQRRSRILMEELTSANEWYFYFRTQTSPIQHMFSGETLPEFWVDPRTEEELAAEVSSCSCEGVNLTRLLACCAWVCVCGGGGGHCAAQGC